MLAEKLIRGYKMKKIISRVCAGLLPVFLAGCSGMSGKFDCNVSSGGRCAPMSQINKMANQGTFQGGEYHQTNTKQSGEVYGYPLNTFAGAPVRSNESIQQIWIGPYEDMAGNYHEPSYVYTVVKKGAWIGDPVGVIQD